MKILRSSIVLWLSFCWVVNAQELPLKINYIHHQELNLDVDYFSEVWLTSEDINDDDIEGFMARAGEKMDMGYYAEALSDIESAISIDSTIAHLYVLHGFCLLGMDSADLALNSFTMASRIDSSNVLSSFYIATYYLNHEQPDTAETIIKEFEKRFGDFAITKYALGNIYLSQYKIEKAIRQYKRAAELNPEFPEALFNIGLIRMLMFDFYNAERFFSKLIKTNPDYAPAYFMKGFLELDGDMKKTYELWEKALALDPENNRYKVSRSILLIYMEDYHSALESLIEVYEENQDQKALFGDYEDNFTDKKEVDLNEQIRFYTDFRDSLSMPEKEYLEEYLCKFIIKEYREADEILGRAMHLFEENALIYYFRGINAEYRYGVEKEKISYYSNALLKKPFLYAGHLRLGIAYADAERPMESVEHLTKFLRYNDTVKIAFRFRGIEYIRLGYYEEALADFDKYFGIDTFDLDLTFNKAVCYKMLQRYPEAILHYNEVLSHRNEDFESVYQKAECYFNMGQLDSVMSSLNKLPETFYYFNAKAYALRGQYYMKCKNYTSAVYDFQKATEQEPYNLQFLYLLADSYRRVKYYDKLLDIYSRMLDQNAQLGDIYFMRGMVYMSQNEKEKACADFEMAVFLGYRQAENALNYQCQSGSESL